jgi:metal-responsive CopG/Arc/MetJ family transcriptional regulator
MDSLFTFRCPRDLLDAITAAAKTDYMSRSDVARMALARVLQDRGLLSKAAQVPEAATA